MLAGIGVLALFLAADAANGLLAAQRAELRALAERRERMVELSGSTAWIDTAREAESALEALEATVPNARSPGLAQALFQTWLRERAAGLDGNVFVDVSPPQPVESIGGLGGIVRVTATVSGRSHRNSVIDLIRRAEASSNLISIDAFNVPGDAASGFSLTLSAYFRIDPESRGDEGP
jgi:hypothetical protein